MFCLLFVFGVLLLLLVVFKFLFVVEFVGEFELFFFLLDELILFFVEELVDFLGCMFGLLELYFVRVIVVSLRKVVESMNFYILVWVCCIGVFLEGGSLNKFFDFD